MGVVRHLLGWCRSALPKSTWIAGNHIAQMGAPLHLVSRALCQPSWRKVVLIMYTWVGPCFKWTGLQVLGASPLVVSWIWGLRQGGECKNTVFFAVFLSVFFLIWQNLWFFFEFPPPEIFRFLLENLGDLGKFHILTPYFPRDHFGKNFFHFWISGQIAYFGISTFP